MFESKEKPNCQVCTEAPLKKNLLLIRIAYIYLSVSFAALALKNSATVLFDYLLVQPLFLHRLFFAYPKLSRIGNL